VKAVLVTKEGTTGDAIDMLSSVAVTLTDTGSVLAADLVALEGATSGLVNATTVTATSGSIADVKTVLVTNEGTTGNKIDMLSSVAATLTDTGSVTVTDLSTIGGATTGTVTVTGAISFTASAAQTLAALVTTDTKVTAASAAVTLNDTGSVSAADLFAIEGATSSLVNATTVTATSGSAADVKAVLVTKEGTTGDAIDMLSSVAVTLTDTGSVSAADLFALEGATSGLVNATTVTATSGSAANVKTVLVTKEGTTGDAIDMLSSVAVTLTDTGSVSAIDLSLIDAAAGTVAGSGITTLTYNNSASATVSLTNLGSQAALELVAGISADDVSKGLTVSGFSLTSGRIKFGETSASVASGYQVISTAGTTLSIGAGGVVEISSGLGDVLSASGGQSIIASAIGSTSGLADGDDFLAICYGSGKAYLYLVEVNSTGAAQSDILANGIDVVLVGVLEGTTADALGSINFGG
jgi:hypothetical protein